MNSTVNRLRQHGLEIGSLPEIEEILPIHFRDGTVLAKRTLALHALLGVIFYQDPKDIVQWVEQEKLESELT